MLYTLQRRYREAWPLHQRELEIWEKTVGPNHPNLSVAHLKSLAELYRYQGLHAEAEQLYKRALAIEKALGPDHPDVAFIRRQIQTAPGDR